ncbi:DUF5324 family protein [Streptomyces palmae]|uniref:Transcriptional regulator n=1 Tax=Streptomyces palmae TaxID=1701085 RepID=A0A4Z0GJN2_9ACTN|nr:DUF5324 family protein [Streptomyces palmae]TGA95596.1 transcriptional regulator [Streptomyces palmae]
MTRTDRVRAATGTAKDNVQHAAEVMAPYAGTAKDTAAHYAHHAKVVLAPWVNQAAQRAQLATAAWYHGPVTRQLEHARCALPPRVDAAAARAAVRTREAARLAADYTVPRVEHAMTVARPAGQEAVARGAAALAALRSPVTAAEIEKLAHRHECRARRGRALRRIALAALLAGGLVAAWKWWDRQANPDWLVEPPAATELGEGGTIGSVDGSGPDSADEAGPNGSR